MILGNWTNGDQRSPEARKRIAATNARIRAILSDGPCKLEEIAARTGAKPQTTYSRLHRMGGVTRTAYGVYQLEHSE